VKTFTWSQGSFFTSTHCINDFHFLSIVIHSYRYLKILSNNLFVLQKKTDMSIAKRDSVAGDGFQEIRPALG
jgi:hypothetical protein